jgi:hypothetical protein
MTVDSELCEEDNGGREHLPRGIVDRRRATRRRVGRVLRVDSMEEEVDGWWHSSVNRGGGKERRAERAGWREGGAGGKRKTSARRAPFIAGRGVGQWRRGGGNGGWEMAGARSRRRYSDSANGRQAPHNLIFFQIIQNWFKFIISKWMPYLAPKILKLCMRPDQSIMNNFSNFADFKFPT